MSKYDTICKDAYKLANSRDTKHQNRDWLDSPWKGFFDDHDGIQRFTSEISATGVSEDVLKRIAQQFSSWPEDFNIHSGNIAPPSLL